MTKTCSRCSVEKPLSQFTPRPERGPNAVRPSCRECAAKVAISYYYANLHAVRERMRVRNKDGWKHQSKAAKALATERHYVANPHKRKAIQTVNNALRDGKLQKLPCLMCGDGKVEAHHCSYAADMWLSVTWLCHAHHMQAHHKEMRGL